jgi:hypothetical protein
MGALLAALLLAQSASAAGQSQAELAEGLQKRITDFEQRQKAGKPPADKSVAVTAAELTAYLNLLTKLPPSLSALDVQFERERIAAKGIVDLDQIPQLQGVSLGPLLSGRVQVSLKGRLTSEDGFGRFEVEDVRLGSIPLSPSVLGNIVASATRTQERPQGFDILAPFRYPYDVRQVKLAPGRAVLEF